MHKNEFNLSTAIFDKRPTVQCWSAPGNILSFKPADPSSDIFKGYSEGVPASPVQLPAGSQWSASRACALCTTINQHQRNFKNFKLPHFVKIITSWICLTLFSSPPCSTCTVGLPESSPAKHGNISFVQFNYFKLNI